MIFEQMFGKGFKLEHIYKAVERFQPTTLRLGTHHYVQMSEKSPEELEVPLEALRSVELVAPFGAAVPRSCEDQLKNTFPSLKGVMNIYGQTEMCVVSAGVSTNTLGSILPGFVVKVSEERKRYI